MKIIVDAMGGDNAPGEIVKGAIEALNARKDIFIYLTGRKPDIEAELSKYTFPRERLEIVHTEEVIETAEPPVMAIRRKKDSSIVKGMPKSTDSSRNPMWHAISPIRLKNTWIDKLSVNFCLRYAQAVVGRELCVDR